LDFFQYAGITYDFRIDPAIDVLISKRTKEGFWKAVSIHPGKVHFEMEKAGQPSKWNTLRVLRVLKKYKPEYYNSMI
jgi:hypothetical protein